MHKPRPFIGTKEVDQRASVFQTKRPCFTQKDDSNQTNLNKLNRRLHPAVESRQSNGLAQMNSRIILLLAKAKQTPHHVKYDYTCLFTLTKGRKPSLEVEHLEHLKHAMNTTETSKKHKSKNKNPRKFIWPLYSPKSY